MELKTLVEFSIEESNNSESGCLISLFCFRNTSPISISNLVLYYVGNKILDGVDSIKSGINLQWIPTPPHPRSKWKITVYKPIKPSM